MKKKHYVTLIKWALFVIYMILLFYVVFFAEGMGRAEIAGQLICKVGCFDVDDLVLNVLGALCGYAVYAIAYRIVKMFSKKDR